jgi:putative ABC transport system substrate-binding protein
MIDRRCFLGAAAASLLAARRARAQSSAKIPVVGFLASGGGESLQQFRDAMRDMGYVEGRNVVLDVRSAAGKPNELPGLAAELVRRNVDVLYTTGPPAVRAAKNATSVIPIVALDLETDPVQSRLVASLARPGGNLTGLFLDLPGLAGKWLELLQAAVPGRRVVALLWDATTGPAQLTAAKAAAQRLDIDLNIVEYRNIVELDSALRQVAGSGLKAVAMLSSPLVSSQSQRIAEFVVRNQLPAISPFRSFADAGGLMSYGPDLLAFRRFAATYVDRILKGAKPGDLPIQQPTKFEFVVNQKTAKALGLVIPPSLLVRADEVIQ